MLLEGKRVLITGVLTEQSIAFNVAKIAQEQGATVVLTGFGRMSLVERIAKRLPQEPPVIELDVTDPDQLASLADRVRSHVDGLDGVVHSIGNAPQGALGGNYLETSWEDVSRALHVSTYSYKALAMATLPLMEKGLRDGGTVGGIGNGGSIVGLTFDATIAWPAYDWMGVAKAGLESCSRYVARYLGSKGIRSNLVSAGPLRTMAAKSIPGFEKFEDAWVERAPLGWVLSDTAPTAKAVVALLSDWFPATTGEIIHVDGGYHALGA
jgi:meromycolic acid enoyl-[acyl-carrier protein] reductase